MLELLLDALQTFGGVEYLVREVKTHRLENYNIKKQSEMRREVETTQLFLILYVVFEEGEKKYRGSYNTEIHPATSYDEILKIIKQGAYAAGFVKNEYHPLVTPTQTEDKHEPERDLAQALCDLESAFYTNDNHQDGNISYSEFFITRKSTRILNSNGVDVKFTDFGVFIETAVHWRDGRGKEIEISEAYRFSLPIDTKSVCEMLNTRVAHLFTVAKQKVAAAPTPQIGSDTNILLTGECLSVFFDYYHSCSGAAMIYQELSTFKEGENLQNGENCDSVALTLLPEMEGSSHSRPYDDNGFPLSDHEIIKDGKLIKFWGNNRFSSYLGIPPTGYIDNMYVAGGTATDDDLRQKPYLELVSFSDFQMDVITGDFGSEIRLGFYFDGEKTVPVTGGSISGNIAAVRDNMRMSREERQYNNYKGPATICIRDVIIGGAE